MVKQQAEFTTSLLETYIISNILLDVLIIV